MQLQSFERYILVTGASGFIGFNIVKALLHNGYRVRAQYRRDNPPEYLRDLLVGEYSEYIDLYQADLTQIDFIKNIVSDITDIIHSASLVSDWGSWESFFNANYLSCKYLCDIGRTYGVQSFLYTSSIIVHGECDDIIEGTEDGPYGQLKSYYARSKKLSEDYVLNATSDTFRCNVIRPGNVYGPYDYTTFLPLFDSMKKGIMGYVNGGKALNPIVYIDDLVQAYCFLLQAEHINGHCFNITSEERISWRDFLDTAADMLHIKPPWINSSSLLLYPLAAVMENCARAFQKKSAPPLTRYRIQAVTRNQSFSMKKARTMLHYYSRVSYYRGLQLTIEYYNNIVCKK